MATAVSAIVAALISYAVSLFTAHNSNKNRQDEQTEWVDRLVSVATKSNADFKQSDILQILSCLRPFEKDEQAHTDSFDQFTKYAIDYCTERRDKLNSSNTTLDSIEYNNLRMIANVLLKNHWEHLSYDSKLLKFYPEDEYMASKFDQIARSAVNILNKDSHKKLKYSTKIHRFRPTFKISVIAIFIISVILFFTPEKAIQSYFNKSYYASYLWLLLLPLISFIITIPIAFLSIPRITSIKNKEKKKLYRYRSYARKYVHEFANLDDLDKLTTMIEQRRTEIESTQKSQPHD